MDPGQAHTFASCPRCGGTVIYQSATLLSKPQWVSCGGSGRLRGGVRCDWRLRLT